MLCDSEGYVVYCMSQREAEALRLRAEIFKALGHPTRLWIVEKLAEGECCVADLAAGVDGGLSAVSQHLALLRQVGIVKDTRHGRQIYYSLTFPAVADVCGMLGARITKKTSPIERIKKLLPTVVIGIVAVLLFGVGVHVGTQRALMVAKHDYFSESLQPMKMVKRTVQITDDYRYCFPKRCTNEGCTCVEHTR